MIGRLSWRTEARPFAARSARPSCLASLHPVAPPAVPGSGAPRTHRDRPCLLPPPAPRTQRNRLYLLRSVIPCLLLLALTSCAYYNTFYLARKYYDRGTLGAPYVAEKVDPSSASNFSKSIDYSKKLIALHPKSKWVDDAYLLWARALIGKDDPAQGLTMLQEFPARYPQSSLKDEALFYLGVAGRKARKYNDALSALEEFLRRQPNHALAPYAYLEQARVLVALEHHGEAATAASQVLDRFPKYKDRDRALAMRAEALLAQGEADRARADYKTLGVRAQSDEQRFTYLLKEADCLENARRYDEELALLGDALSHEQEPLRATVPQTRPGPPGQLPANETRPQVFQPQPASAERWGRLTIRIGTVHMLAGRKPEALKAYRDVVSGFPLSALAAEAQYRVGYVYETVADDFEGARQEYARVAKLSAGSPYAVQASQRLASLERLTQVRAGSGSDSLAKKAEAGFMIAELYLFQNNKPDRALEEYRKIAETFPGTPWAGKAMNAQAWVLRHKFERAAEADSILWAVIHGFPKTEAQVHARDYLELAGQLVPDSLIQVPDLPAAPRDTGLALTPVPAGTDSLGPRRPMLPDSLARLFIRAGESAPPSLRSDLEQRRLRVHADSTRTPAPADSLGGRAPADSTRAKPPTDFTPADADTTEDHRR